MLCNHYLYVVPRLFHHPKRNPIPIIPQPWKPLLCPLPLRIHLFWTFPTCGILPCVAFCVWILLLSRKFPRAIHVIAGVRSSFHPVAGEYFIVRLDPILWGHLGLSPFGLLWTSRDQFCVNPVFSSLRCWSAMLGHHAKEVNVERERGSLWEGPQAVFCHDGPILHSLQCVPGSNVRLCSYSPHAGPAGTRWEATS